MKHLGALLVVSFALFVFSACSLTPTPNEPGIVEITVDIGPFPKPGDGPDDFLASHFQPRLLVMLSEDGFETLKALQLGTENPNTFTAGTYQNIFGMEPGTYTVDINLLAGDVSFDLPRNIEVRSGETTKVNIEIDMLAVKLNGGEEEFRYSYGQYGQQPSG